jgi:predicted  nucleic acid-binding Zn-ribbon protein
MVSKAFSYRLPQKAVQALEALRLEDETLNQTAQRTMMEYLGLSTETSQLLSTVPSTDVDIQEFKHEVEASLADIRSQLESLRGKLKAR